MIWNCSFLTYRERRNRNNYRKRYNKHKTDKLFERRCHFNPPKLLTFSFTIVNKEGFPPHTCTFLEASTLNRLPNEIGFIIAIMTATICSKRNGLDESSNKVSQWDIFPFHVDILLPNSTQQPPLSNSLSFFMSEFSISRSLMRASSILFRHEVLLIRYAVLLNCQCVIFAVCDAKRYNLRTLLLSRFSSFGHMNFRSGTSVIS